MTPFSFSVWGHVPRPRVDTVDGVRNGILGRIPLSVLGTRKIRISALLVALSVAAAGKAEPLSPAGTRVQYTCSGQQDILIERDHSLARVTFGARSYVLARKSSDIGQKYLSRSAALIIDGPSAVFVADDGTDLGMCMETVPVASAH